MNPDRISYAQNREDIILSGFFTDVHKGFYVDVGANDPTFDSVTKYFYDRGWHGINIEPIPNFLGSLQKFRPRDINLQIGVGEKKGRATLHYYPYGDGLSTMSSDMAAEHKHEQSAFTKDAEEIEVDVLPLKDVLAKHAGTKTIHFMKIDVEGFETSVIKGNDWAKFRPQVLCIESNHVFNDWEPILEKHGYKKVFFDGLNDYFVAKEASDRAKNFSYIQTVIGLSPVHYLVAEGIVQSEQQINRQSELLVSSRQRIMQLEDEINRSKSFKESLRQFAKATHHANLRIIDHLKPMARSSNLELSGNNPKQLLDSVQAYDKENEQLHNTSFGLRMLPYLIVSGAYKLLFLIVKKSEKVVRTMLHKIRNRS